MRLQYKGSDVLKGGLIYSLGDTIATFISNELDLFRLLGMFIIGATIYSFEIPNYFRWIDQKIDKNGSFKSSITRAGLAMLYFNPLWIARHILFIHLISGKFDLIGWEIITVGAISFLFNIPISLIANYIIQNKIKLSFRFIASAIFSGLMAIYYSLSAIWFQ